MSSKCGEKPISKSIIRRALMKGHIPFSVDVDRIDEYKSYVHVPIGSKVSIRGIIVYYPEKRKVFLRPFLSNPYISIQLLNISLELAQELHGGQVEIEGIKDPHGLKVLRINRVKIVSKPPPISFKYVLDTLLNGIDVKGPKELSLLALISSPRTSLFRLGGIHIVLFGRNRSVFDKRLRSNTIAIPRIWRYGKTDLGMYTSSKRYLSIAKRSKETYAEISLNIDSRNRVDQVIEAPIDYPVIIEAQSQEIAPDFDIIDYSLYVKALIPKEPPDLERVMVNLSNSLRLWIEKEGLLRGIIGNGKFIDLNYYGKPASILRIALAIARTRWCEELEENHIIEAYNLLKKALETFLQLFSVSPRRILTLTQLETVILKTVERLETQYRDGVPYSVLLNELRARNIESIREIERALAILRSKGLIYMPKQNHFKVVSA